MKDTILALIVHAMPIGLKADGRVSFGLTRRQLEFYMLHPELLDAEG